jgi:hypothetical protein
MFRTRKTRPGAGALCTPGTAVPARPRMNPMTAACRLTTAGPCHPGTATRPGMFSSRGISKGSLAFTHPGHSPHLWPPDGTGTLGLCPGLHTRLSRTQPRMPGRGRASGTGPGSRHRHQRPPSADPLNTSDLMSQFTLKVPSTGDGQDPRQALFFQVKGTFSCDQTAPAYPGRKPEARAARTWRSGLADPSGRTYTVTLTVYLV